MRFTNKISTTSIAPGVRLRLSNGTIVESAGSGGSWQPRSGWYLEYKTANGHRGMLKELLSKTTIDEVLTMQANRTKVEDLSPTAIAKLMESDEFPFSDEEETGGDGAVATDTPPAEPPLDNAPPEGDLPPVDGEVPAEEVETDHVLTVSAKLLNQLLDTCRNCEDGGKTCDLTGLVDTLEAMCTSEAGVDGAEGAEPCVLTTEDWPEIEAAIYPASDEAPGEALPGDAPLGGEGGDADLIPPTDELEEPDPSPVPPGVEESVKRGIKPVVEKVVQPLVESVAKLAASTSRAGRSFSFGATKNPDIIKATGPAGLDMVVEGINLVLGNKKWLTENGMRALTPYKSALVADGKFIAFRK